MTPEQINAQLEACAAAGPDHFQYRSIALTHSWAAAGIGTEVMESVFRFMEAHPEIDFGTPGPLVHYLERFPGEELERRLLESLGRRPVFSSVSMLNATINVTADPEKRRHFVSIMTRIATDPVADEGARAAAEVSLGLDEDPETHDD